MNKPVSSKQKYLYTKMNYIKDALPRLYNLISNNDSYVNTYRQLRSIEKDLWYVAPELLDQLWLDVNMILLSTIPIQPDSPICVTHIHSIYNTTTEKLNKLDYSTN